MPEGVRHASINVKDVDAGVYNAGCRAMGAANRTTGQIEEDEMQQRRSFLKHSALGLGAIPLANLLAGGAWAAGEVELTEDDPMAAALGYKHVAEEGGQAGVPRTDDSFCDNCAQYVATQEDWGTCNIFPGKLVAAKGWCNVWVAMPAS